MDINWWIVSTAVLWVLGGVSVAAHTMHRGRDAANIVIVALWPFATVLGAGLGVCDLIRRKRG